MKRTTFFSVLAGVWAVMVGAAMLLPASRLPALPALPTWSDKVVHLVLFYVLARLCALSIGLVAARRWFALAMVGLYAVILEALQVGVPGRAFDFFDLVAAFAGIGLVAYELRRGAVVWRGR